MSSDVEVDFRDLICLKVGISTRTRLRVDMQLREIIDLDVARDSRPHCVITR